MYSTQIDKKCNCARSNKGDLANVNNCGGITLTSNNGGGHCGKGDNAGYLRFLLFP